METPWTDDELLEHMRRLRKQLDKYQLLIERGENPVDVKQMREEMSRLNHYKLEARRRGLRED